MDGVFKIKSYCFIELKLLVLLKQNNKCTEKIVETTTIIL